MRKPYKSPKLTPLSADVGRALMAGNNEEPKAPSDAKGFATDCAELD